MSMVIPCRARKLLHLVAPIWWLGSRARCMYRRGRPIEPLLPDEGLFQRWFSDWFESPGEIRPAMISIPDQSLNRERFGGRSWHVLLPDPGEDSDRSRRRICQGVIRFQTRHFSMRRSIGGRDFEFRVEHDPLEFNYGHCELRVYQDGTRLDEGNAKALKGAEKSAWTEAKKWFRTEVAKMRGEISVAIQSSVATGQ